MNLTKCMIAAAVVAVSLAAAAVTYVAYDASKAKKAQVTLAGKRSSWG